MSNDARYDIVIIGSGAGGGTLARHLAPSGLRIAILERGGYLPRERENWDERAVFDEKRYLAQETWYEKDDKPFQPYTHYWVGGNTKVYGAALLRMRERDFGEVRHAGGVSPAWPISYADLEPYYAMAERLYDVHGERGIDPTEPWCSTPLPHRAPAFEPRMRELSDEISALGLRPFPIPLGVRSGVVASDKPGASPYRLSRFDGYPDLTEAKSDAHVCGVRPALASPNVVIFTETLVERLETDPAGREVTRIIATRGGERVEIRGDIVVLACGAINSAALLLRSASAPHPKGLANASDLVGRNYMTHQNGCFIVVSEKPNPSAFQKAFGIADFYETGGPGGTPLGLIQLMGKPDRGTLEWLRSASPEADARLSGVSMDDLRTRTIDFFLTAEDLPSPGNRVTLRGDGSIKVSYTPNNTGAYEGLKARLEGIMARVEAASGRATPAFLHARLGVSGVSHQNGTLRFGTDPKASVLDVDCRAHGVANLYAVDASCFPSSSAVNPSLTIMANALRVGDRILERMGATGRRVRQEVAV